MNRIGNYAKSISTVIAAGIGILAAALSDGTVSATEYINIVIAILTAVGVYIIPNLNEGAQSIAKTLVAFGGAAATALVTVLAGSLGFADVGQSDWLLVLLAGLSAIGVYIVPNNSGTSEKAGS